MKKAKIVNNYKFKNMSYSDMVMFLNKELPINIKYNEELINRIHCKYPILSKSQISMIVKLVFQSIRDFLVLGKILNFNKLFFDTKLHFFDYRRKGRILKALKVKISTPPPIRNL